MWLSENDDPKRKLRYTLEIVESNGTLVGVNTGRANELVAEALNQKVIAELSAYEEVRREVTFDDSRIDFLLEYGGPQPACFVEVKSVTLVEREVALFPDAITLRGRKHLDTLERIVVSGHRAAMLFVVQRADGVGFRPAYHIDREYALRLRQVHGSGVELLVYRAEVLPEEIRITEKMNWEF